MSKETIEVISLRFDTEELTACSKITTDITRSLSQQVKAMSIGFVDIFGNAQKSAILLADSTVQLLDNFKELERCDIQPMLASLSDISASLDGISLALDEILKKLHEPDWINIASLVLSGIQTIPAIQEIMPGGKFESGAKSLTSGTGGKYLSEQLPDSVITGIGMLVDGVATSFDGLLTKMKNIDINTVCAPFAKMFQNIDQLVGGKISGLGDTIKNVFGGITNSMSSLSLGWGAIVLAVIALVVAIVQNWDAIKAAIGAAAEWVNTNIIQPVVGFFTELWTSITTIVNQIWNGIVAVVSGVAQWFYDNVISPVMAIFSPIVEWYAQLFGSVWQTVSDIFHNIGVIISGCWEVIKAVWGIVANWFNDAVIQPVVQFFSGLWKSISGFAVDAWTAIKETFLAVANWFNTNVIQPVAGFFAGLWEGFKQAAASAWDGVKSVFSAVAGFFKDIFGAAWAGVVKVFSAAGNIFNNIKDGILSVFKTIVNGLIDGINAVVAVPFKGINGALSIIKNIEIVGAKPFGGLKLLSIPQIPHLARGAVLPANRPFMAIVGDQRHGTNVEAPLSVIQEAVALVMEDQTAAIVSGFNASIGVQREILGAVLGIQIGDEMIAAAADRYRRKMAVMKGV